MSLDDIGFSSFACTCSTEGKADCEAALAWAYEFCHGATAEDFLTRAIYKIDGFRYHITGLPTDQWSAIAASPYEGYTDEGQQRTSDAPLLYIQCDRVEHGLAFALRALFNKFGNSRPWVEDEDEELDGRLSGGNSEGAPEGSGAENHVQQADPGQDTAQPVP